MFKACQVKFECTCNSHSNIICQNSAFKEWYFNWKENNSGTKFFYIQTANEVISIHFFFKVKSKLKHCSTCICKWKVCKQTRYKDQLQINKVFSLSYVIYMVSGIY